MDTTFSHERRVLLCQQCGAPLEAIAAGGNVQCRYCGTYSALGVRDERPLFAVGAQSALPEPERLARLRAQDGRPLLPPHSLLPLLPNGVLEAWKVNEAVAVWQSTRAQLRSQPDFDAAERLLFLTMVLAQYFFEQGDRVRQRALFESALESFGLPRHRQMMLGYLSRCACRAGDLAAAQRWLAQCDPRPDDLAMDSSYRYSHAFLDTVLGNFPSVLAALGNHFDEVPIQDAIDASACALRANALEKLGHVDAAAQELRLGFQRGSAMRQSIEQFIALHPSFALCPASLPRARSGHAEQAATLAASRASGGAVFAWAFLLVGSVSLFVALVLGAIELAPLVGFELLGGPPQGEDPYPIMILVFGIIGPLFFGIGAVAFFAASAAKRLRLHGIRAQARVLGLLPTNMSINDRPVMKVQVSIEMPGRAPYTAESRAILDGVLAARAIPGALLPVRVDPKRPQKFILELD